MLKLLESLNSDAVLLTPNRRLSAAFLKLHFTQQINQQKQCWPSLNALPLTSWLQQLWRDLTVREMDEFALLLSPEQESLIWETIIKDSPISDSLLQVAATAELVQSAWGLLKQWQVKLNHPDLTLTEDGIIFLQWANDFANLCQKNKWLDSASLLENIVTQLSKSKFALPSQIVLFGFTELSPAQLAFFRHCEALGSEVIHYESPSKASQTYKIGLTDEAAELYTMARWAKHIYENHSKKSSYLIGCVIPNLDAIRDSVVQIFSEVFSEPNKLTLDTRLLPFNISAGKLLVNYPIVYAALLALRHPTESIPIDEISYLLRSPYLGSAEEEALARAELDNDFRNANITALTINELSIRATSCPKFVKNLKKYINLYETMPQKATVAIWAGYFTKLLTALGWPGERSLNSIEYQVIQRWLELFSEYSSFHSVVGMQGFFQAKKILFQSASRTTFQPQTPEAPIQVLGVLEAAGLPFENIWLMGMEDTTWPSPPKPNPFIPQRLQKALQMPHANADRELFYCENLIAQFKQCAHHIVFSYPQKNATGNLRPSTFLNGVPSISLDELSLANFEPPSQKIFSMQLIESIIDEMAPEISHQEKIFGGINIFKLQAACPFKAFSELRLHARKLETPEIGIKPKDRGILLHKALEILWERIEDSDKLSQINNEELTKLIEECTQNAAKITLPNMLPMRRYFDLELQRISKLIFDWMQKERERPYFKVTYREFEKSFTVNQIPITLRVDRIDELADGNKLILDYKTGKNNFVKDWFGEKISEPQLPLYCISDIDKTVGIAFAQIHSEQVDFKGISKNDIGIKSFKQLTEVKQADSLLWDEQVSLWKSVIESLGKDFSLGNAVISPKEDEKTCRQCHLQPFCRIHEKAYDL